MLRRYMIFPAHEHLMKEQKKLDYLSLRVSVLSERENNLILKDSAPVKNIMLIAVVENTVVFQEYK